MSKKILCIHQSAELYGSDRSFLSAVEALVEGGAIVDVMLPEKGRLGEMLVQLGCGLSYYKYGVIRKTYFSFSKLNYLFGIFSSIPYFYNAYKKYDIVYLNTIVLLGPILSSFIFSRFCSASFFCHVREIPAGFVLKIYRLLLKCSRCELIFNSKATRRAFGLPGRVIYNGVEVQHALESALEVSKKNFDCNNVKLLLIGRLSRWKGQEFVIEALGEMPASVVAKLRLTILGSPVAGNEQYLDFLRDLVSAKNLSGNITFASFSDNPDKFYRDADFVLVPSVSPEPFGRVAIEAFANKVPVIAAAHGGLLEIVTDYENGLLFEPCSSKELSKVLEQVSTMRAIEWQRMSGLAKAEFDKRFGERQYKEVILEVIGGAS